MARSYTDAEKADAVAIYLEHGLAEAHHRTGIPKPTLRDWARKAGHDPAELGSRTAAKTKAATEAHTLGMAEKRALLREELATAALHHVRQSAKSTDGRQAQAWMVAGAIGVDKLRLELGEVTDRTEHVAPERSAEVEEELAKVVELAEHRAA